MTAAGTVASGSSGRVVQRLDFLENREFDSLNHELSDSVTAADVDGCGRIEIDQADLEFAPVFRVHGSGRIHDRQSRFGGESGTRMDQPDGAHRQRDRDPRSDQCSMAGFDGDVAGGAQIHTRISGMRTLWNGQVWIQSLQGDGEMVAHVGQDYS
ncbi:hypothetical protein GCM10020255_077250 [Rhodococcus baikonurensis]